VTIEDAEHQIEDAIDKLRSSEYEPLQPALQRLIPQGFRPRVALYGAERKKKKNASADNWSPESGEIRIFFERIPAASPAAAPGSPKATPPHAARPAQPASGPSLEPPARDPLSDLVQALDRVESRPGLEFVALKWFRDTALPAEGFAWCESDSARQDVLRGAIEKRMVLTGKVSNPRAPQFPVTSIRLNRLLPEVRTILGSASPRADEFEPAAIRGESLSTTILRERR
jgi:hypothetical protein